MSNLQFHLGTSAAGTGEGVMNSKSTRILASLSRFCAVCDDRRAVAVVRLLDPDIAGSGRSRCPHCSPCRSQGETAIPIYDYDMHLEVPRAGSRD